MMTIARSVRSWMSGKLAEIFAAWCRRREMVAFPSSQVGVMRQETAAMVRFTERSGFLRDGRYPGGRHAERKILAHVTALQVGFRQGIGEG